MRTRVIRPFGETRHSTRTQPETPLASRGYLGRGDTVMMRYASWPFTSMASPGATGGSGGSAGRAEAVRVMSSAAATARITRRAFVTMDIRIEPQDRWWRSDVRRRSLEAGILEG